MVFIRVINVNKNTVLAQKAQLADTLFRRSKGLLGRSGLELDEALILKPCSSIHTFFMRFPIDVAFVDRENRVIKTYSCLKSWRLTAVFLNAAFCIELPSGALSATQTQEGDYVQLLPV